MCVRFRTSHSRRGAVAVLAAFMMVFLMGMVAFAVDIGYLCVVQTQAQAAADAAALAGAKGLPSVRHRCVANAEACAALNTANGQACDLAELRCRAGDVERDGADLHRAHGDCHEQRECRPSHRELDRGEGQPGQHVLCQRARYQDEEHHRFRDRGRERWDVVIAQDISSSYSADLSYAITGHQVLLADFNQYSPSSNFGVVQHTGWGSTWAALQPVGSNYSTLNTTIGNLADCSNNTTSAYNVYGGTATSIAVTTQTPACSGSDLATGIQQAINMFNSAAYTSTAPAGTAKAIIISSDGESNASSNGQHPSPNIPTPS